MAGRAFADEPLLRWPLGAAAEPLVAIEEDFVFVCTVAHDLGCLWEAGGGEGAAAWIGPQESERYWRAMLGFSGGIAGAALDGGARQAGQWEWISSRYPASAFWLLDFVAVDPLRQRGGVGASLITHGLRLAGEEGLSAYLETSRGYLVAYYQRFGFAVVDEGDVPGGGPHVWFMCSPAPA